MKTSSLLTKKWLWLTTTQKEDSMNLHQKPGYTAWTGASLAPDGSIIIAFTQSTGNTAVQGNDARKLILQQYLSYLGYPNGHYFHTGGAVSGDAGKYPAYRDHYGLNVSVLYFRQDVGTHTWQNFKVDNETPTLHPIAYTPQALIVLRDGTMIRRVNGEDIRYEKLDNPNARATAYLQFLPPTTDAKWSNPLFLMDTTQYTYQISRIKYLADNKTLIALGQVWGTPEKPKVARHLMMISTDEGKTWENALNVLPETPYIFPNEWDVTDIPGSEDLLAIYRSRHLTTWETDHTQVRVQATLKKTNADMWTLTNVFEPQIAHSGHPDLITTKEGVIIYFSSAGSLYTVDKGASWQPLTDTNGTQIKTHWYPRSIQNRDGVVHVFSHIGADDDYGVRHQAIIEQKFILQ